MAGKIIKILYIFLLFFSLKSFSQKTIRKSISLDWEMSKELEVSNGIKLTYPLVKGNFLDASGIPSFYENWLVPANVSGVNHSLENVVYETVDSRFLQQISIEAIPFSLKSSLNISYANEMRSASFSITPMIREGDIVRKIVSFDLLYTLNTQAKKTEALSDFSDSVLTSGTWFKFSIDKTGVFKMDKTFLNSLGVSTDGLDPRNIRIYGNGGEMLPNLNSDFRHDDIQENAIFVNGEADGVFNDSDYVLFYGQGAHDWIKENENTISHRKNIYSEKAFYFLNVDLGPGKRVADAPEVTETTTDIVSTFKDHLFNEVDRVNLIGAGQQWFGDSFLVQNTRNYSFSLNNIDTAKDVYFKVRAASTATTATSLNVSVNSTALFNLSFSAISGITKARASVNSGELDIDDASLNIQLAYNNNGNPGAEAFLDYIEVIGDRFLIADGNQFGFRNFISQEPSKVLEYVVQNKNQVNMIWDVSNPLEPQNLINQTGGDDFHFKKNSGGLGEYHVISNSNFYLPEVIQQGAISNQNLHGLRDIQYLLITKENFVSHAQRLANYHSSNSNLSTRVVSLNQIYNEFGSGSPDVTAIRDFVKYLYDNATSDDNRIKYLCTFGDSSYDYKDRISGNNNIVPVYLAYESFDLVNSYVTDDYYGMMDSNEGNMTSTDKQDVATGRILVSDDAQATIVVDKILAYYNNSSFENWHNQITLATDDLDNASEFVFQTDMDEIAESIVLNKPQYNIKKIYSDAYVKQQTTGGTRYPDVNAAITNSLEKGTLLFNYFGHGGEQGFASERIFTIPDIKSLVNFEKSPLFITITCDFTRFDNPARFTAGEEMITSRIGGTGNMISTTREVYIFYGRNFNKILMPKILGYDGNDNTIAENLMDSKNEVSPSLSQRFFIFYLGDPAMKLARPGPSVAITHINGVDISQPRDTLKALSKINIAGEVRDSEGNILTGYNGNLSTTIFDKPTNRETLNNKGFTDNSGTPLIMEFETQENAVFKGKSEIKNGVFNFDFIVPKDIKISYGAGKISLYAFDDEAGKGGYDLATVVGGVNDDAEEDLVGPSIELFLNDDSFQDGGNTSAIPKLIAKLSDDSGINTSSGAIGHAITAVIDGNEGNPIQLNEFYEAETGDFTKGNVNYTLRKLEPGEHSLKLKVWDTYNNASDKTLTFTVTSSDEFVLENVLNYPNPFVNYTEFWFTHNQPNELLNVKIYVYTVSGKLIKSISEVVQTTGSLSRTISWDGKDDFGDKVGKGVYVYKIEVTNVISGVKAEKFEKLVLLQ